MAEEDNKNNCENPRQTIGNKHEQFKGMEQEAETQNTQDANFTNPMVIGNNNKESIADTKDNNSIDFLSELLISKNLIADAETKNDATTIDMQINCDNIDFLAESLIHHSSFVIEEEENDTATQNTIINNNNNESLIIGIGTDVGKQEQTMQKKKEGKIKTKTKINKY